MDDGIILFVSILIAISFAVFNLVGVVIALVDRRLRGRISTYPIVSFLLASTLQGLFAAPIYAYKQMEHIEHISEWMCDLSEISHYLCHHLVKISLLIVSFDRLFSIKYPFKYENYGTKRIMVFVIVVSWVVTVAIDMLPFIHEDHDDMCHYTTTKVWSISIVVLYSIIPLCIITVNYIIIWIVAAKAALFDRCVSQRFTNSITAVDADTARELFVNDPRKLTRAKSKFRFMLEMKATKSSMALMAIYLICWGPLGVYNVYDSFCGKCLSGTNRLDINTPATVAIKLLCFSSSILAPLLHYGLSKDFRKASKRVLRRFGWTNNECSRKKAPSGPITAMSFV